MSVLARLLNPLSLRALILFGFAAAVLPLTVTLISVVHSVDELAGASKAMASEVVELTQKNELLRERLVDFERKAKRYRVLNDADSRSALDGAYRNFTNVLEELAELSRGSSLAVPLRALAADADAVYRRVSVSPPANLSRKQKGPLRGTQEPILGGELSRLGDTNELFTELTGKVREIARAISRIVAVKVQDLEVQSGKVQQGLLIRSSVWLPVSLALISLLTFLIIRSVRQMDLAIRRLGAGDLVRPVRVTGPKDMEYLGERLDWLRSRLRALEEAKQQFTRHVSHELKTPLATIHEGTELLADEVVGELNTEQREIAHILLANTQKLDTLIAELINYSQANARPSAQRRERVDVQRVVEAVIEDSQIRLRAKSISIKSTLQPIQVRGSPEQLRTIVDNLLSNAIKYSPVAGEIRVSLGQTGGHMELEIEDDGPGIEPEERKHIFEPFFQGKAAKEGEIGGTGLGLAIVSECVAGHQGKVEALEPRPDKTGARIRVQIPCRQSG
jgi:two-component system sensor histidine kinase GlrK